MSVERAYGLLDLICQDSLETPLHRTRSYALDRIQPTSQVADWFSELADILDALRADLAAERERANRAEEKWTIVKRELDLGLDVKGAVADERDAALAEVVQLRAALKEARPFVRKERYTVAILRDIDAALAGGAGGTCECGHDRGSHLRERLACYGRGDEECDCVEFRPRAGETQQRRCPYDMHKTTCSRCGECQCWCHCGTYAPSGGATQAEEGDEPTASVVRERDAQTDAVLATYRSAMDTSRHENRRDLGLHVRKHDDGLCDCGGGHHAETCPYAGLAVDDAQKGETQQRTDEGPTKWEGGWPFDSRDPFGIFEDEEFAREDAVSSESNIEEGATNA